MNPNITILSLEEAKALSEAMIEALEDRRAEYKPGHPDRKRLWPRAFIMHRDTLLSLRKHGLADKCINSNECTLTYASAGIPIITTTTVPFGEFDVSASRKQRYD